MTKIVDNAVKKLRKEVIENKCKNVNIAYTILLFLMIIHSFCIFTFSIAAGIEGVKYPGSYTLYFFKARPILKIAIVIETIYSLLYLIPLGIAFVHDLLHEEKPKYLLTMFMVEILVFIFLRFVESFGNNIVLLIFGIAALILFGSFSFIMVDAIGIIVGAGIGIWTSTLYIGIPVITIIFLIQCIMEIFA